MKSHLSRLAQAFFQTHLALSFRFLDSLSSLSSDSHSRFHLCSDSLSLLNLLQIHFYSARFKRILHPLFQCSQAIRSDKEYSMHLNNLISSASPIQSTCSLRRTRFSLDHLYIFISSSYCVSLIFPRFTFLRRFVSWASSSHSFSRFARFAFLLSALDLLLFFCTLTVSLVERSLRFSSFSSNFCCLFLLSEFLTIYSESLVFPDFYFWRESHSPWNGWAPSQYLEIPWYAGS